MCNAQDCRDNRIRQHLNVVSWSFAAFYAGRRESQARFHVVFHLVQRIS
jgi:hypothetical protein